MYGTVNDADSYLATRIGGSGWLSLPEASKLQYLTSAFDVIESLSFDGDKTDSEQENQFPRDGATEVPSAVINAEYQLAFCMWSQNYQPGRVTGRSLKRSKTDVVETEYFEGVSDFTFEGVNCPRAYQLLSPYFTDPNGLELDRTN